MDTLLRYIQVKAFGRGLRGYHTAWLVVGVAVWMLNRARQPGRRDLPHQAQAGRAPDRRDQRARPRAKSVRPLSDVGPDEDRSILGPGERVLLVDAKERRYLITLRTGASFHTHVGIVDHDDLIGVAGGVDRPRQHRPAVPGGAAHPVRRRAQDARGAPRSSTRRTSGPSSSRRTSPPG